MALRGVKVLEMAGLAPAPFCGMVLSDLGATVVRVDKTGHPNVLDVSSRGKRSISINLKHEDGQQVLRKLSHNYDVLIEPFRKGVMERLNLGPDILCKDNPKLIYARLTGYGQDGPLSTKAGHDINYLSYSGVLSRLGRAGTSPLPPINLLADFAGGGLICALGILAAIIDRFATGQGQVIDSSMIEGAAYVSSWLFKSRDMPIWGNPRGSNVLDSGAHFYETYKTKDGKYMAVGAIEPQFYADFLKGLSFTPEELPQYGGDSDQLKSKVQARFLEKTREEWTEVFEELDACVTPVLEMDEAPEDSHNTVRGSFGKSFHGHWYPIPAPRLSNHPKDPLEAVSHAQPTTGQHTLEVLQEAGFNQEELHQLLRRGAIQHHHNMDKAKL